MKKVILCISILLFIAGCKKKQESDCSLCSCIANTGYIDDLVDSAAFHQAILGTWYLKQFDSVNLSSCQKQCICDTQFTFIFLADSMLVMSLPGNRHDTVSYLFQSDSVHQINLQSGTFTLPGNPSQSGQIYYSSSFIGLTTVFPQGPTAGTIDYPFSYILTRN